MVFRAQRLWPLALLVLGIFALFLFVGGGGWLQSNLLSGNGDAEVALWSHDFSTGLPEGWQQNICNSVFENTLPEPFVCLQGDISAEVPSGVRAIQLRMTADSLSQESFDMQLAMPDQILTQHFTVQGRQMLTFDLPVAHPIKTKVVMKFPAATNVHLYEMALVAERDIPVSSGSGTMTSLLMEENHDTGTSVVMETSTGTSMTETSTGTVVAETSTGTTITTTVTTNTNVNAAVANTNTNVATNTNANTNSITDANVNTNVTTTNTNANGNGNRNTNVNVTTNLNANTNASTVQNTNTNTAQQVISAVANTNVSIPPQTTAIIQARSFSDVDDANFARSAIEALANRQAITGYPDGTFRPFDAMNRAEWSKVLVASTPSLSPSASASTSLHDISGTDWYAPYVSTLVQNGVVQGYPDGTFRSANKVTRAEALKMLVLASGISDATVKADFDAWLRAGNDIANVFSDTANNIWYSPYLYEAYKTGLLSGKMSGATRLADPLSNISRGEAATLLYRFISRS